MLGLNIVDLGIIVVLVLYILVHIQEGFLALTERLISFFGAVFLAFLTYGYASRFFDPYVSWPPGILDALSFILIFMLMHTLLSYILEEISYYLPESFHHSRLSEFLAIIPALIDGLVLISLTLLLLVIMPVLPELKNPIENSRIGSSLINRIAGVEVYVDRIFGRATQETLGFLTVRPEEGESINLPFSAERLRVDEGAEARMLELVNAERAKVGAPPVVVDPTIVVVAREHSRDMWERSYFSHQNPDGETPFDRMDEGGVDFRAAGENLALARTVERAHVGLMNSPGHRRNILDPTFTRIGIGVIDGGIYGKMFTQNFAD